jgi:carboxylesterase
MCILLFHGVTATIAEVRLLANRLFVEGFSVASPLLPGHGTTPTELNHCRWQDWTAAAEASYKEFSHRCETIVVGGESMGALLACWIAARQPEAAVLLLYAPAISVPSLRKASRISWIIPLVRKRIGKDGLPWKGYTVWPLRAAHQMFQLQRTVIECLPNIRQPTLVFQGRFDRTIHPDSGKLIMDRIASPHKVLHWLDHSSHCILLDRELDLISRLTVQFIHNHTKLG